MSTTYRQLSSFQFHYTTLSVPKSELKCDTNNKQMSLVLQTNGQNLDIRTDMF